MFDTMIAGIHIKIYILRHWCKKIKIKAIGPFPNDFQTSQLIQKGVHISIMYCSTQTLLSKIASFSSKTPASLDHGFSILHPLLVRKLYLSFSGVTSQLRILYALESRENWLSEKILEQRDLNSRPSVGFILTTAHLLLRLYRPHIFFL